jgi:hypothetical protein
VTPQEIHGFVGLFVHSHPGKCREYRDRRRFPLLRAIAGGYLLVLTCGCFSASAIVDAASPANTNQPPDQAPWSNVGLVNGASGVYLGAGWMLTASHVGAGNTILNGLLFQWDGGFQRLTNGDGSATDLILFHLKNLPALPKLTLASSPPSSFSLVDFIGYGRIAGSTETNIGANTGFYWSASGFKSWGNNKVNLGGLKTINAGAGNVTVFVTDFTSPATPGPTGPTSDEAQAAAGDSGGGVFLNGGSNWQLVGMIDAINTQSNQTDNTAVYGDLTFIANISTYRAQMIAILASTTPQLSIYLSGGNLLICWTDTGVSYELQLATNISVPNWTVITPELVYTNGLVCATLSASQAAGFYRLQKP